MEIKASITSPRKYLIELSRGTLEYRVLTNSLLLVVNGVTVVCNDSILHIVDHRNYTFL